ncbi:A/G-specific adenine glycosylase [Campylobacter sp. MIT 21-1685]|uniref:A/G-specific adenine glycosylase n=1 Tax=unclassified Campylobacter TaxID=2593542 RepID=UPI00224A65D7|nr:MULTISPECIES: A/G-specific adenine glycosylase [unclassified Campylobacter]MCX2682650.1 A/G-specific adenine glycosylase [Campylobacter sp. MIT 21-1684]MCX2750930.1 A/G-specific adenine glycosylase [Campylobacter sp. MIT 21-1682]MCX2807137.1 A/G-specific adenine glycosylase [Campylobacter sp. MIT 21-1685]
MKKHHFHILHSNLLLWYEKNGRKNLPWRNLESPLCDKKIQNIQRAYGVYISEIMLQQTQVKRVLENFYFPFLSQFPHLESLAKANDNELLKAWQGLGFYTRARNLKKSALECMQNFNGNLPQDLKALQSLSGVGAYTAGAIACFGFNQAVSFFDSNIARVLSRLFGLENPNPKELQTRADSFLNTEDAFNHNQALLDLGALVCLPNNPKCGLCPLYETCKGKYSPALYYKKKKTLYQRRDLKLFFIEHNATFAVQKSTEKLYNGLYNFPCTNTTHNNKKAKFLGEFKHSYTKYKLYIKMYHYKTSQRLNEYEFKTIEELDTMPLSALSLKALKYLQKK